MKCVSSRFALVLALTLLLFTVAGHYTVTFMQSASGAHHSVLVRAQTPPLDRSALPRLSVSARASRLAQLAQGVNAVGDRSHWQPSAAGGYGGDPFAEPPSGKASGKQRNFEHGLSALAHVAGARATNTRSQAQPVVDHRDDPLWNPQHEIVKVRGAFVS